ncbi:hypothetical protein Hanom_Chr15g01414551 [Helianthus anomalus]
MFKGSCHFVQIKLDNDLHSCGGLIYNFLVIWSSSNLLLGECFPNRLELGSILNDLFFRSYIIFLLFIGSIFK